MSKPLFFTTLIAIACVAGAAAQTSAPPATPTTPAVTPLLPPSDDSIPAGPKGAAIRAGKLLLTETHQRLPANVGNGLTCANCHLGAGTVALASPWLGLWGVFPEYRARSGKVISLQERINDCFERSMNGKALAYNADEMNNMLSYIQWLSSAVPTGVSVKGRGFGRIDQALVPDRAHGQLVYTEKCASCHGAAGAGIQNADGGYAFPPLWGGASFNDGAGMARTTTAAAFVKYNMPLGQGGTLTDQQAIDVADFFTHQPRPVFAGKNKDWPNGDQPKDARN